MDLTTLTVADLFKEASDLARDQGIHSQEEWDDVIEEVVDGHIDLGELDLDQDTEGIKETLSNMWIEYRREVAEEGVGQDEDVNEDELEREDPFGQTVDEEEEMM